MSPGSRTDTILIVDDDPSIRQALAELLGDAGYKVETAADAGETFVKIGHSPPDLIVLDVLLPGEDGFDIAARLKSTGKTGDIPIVFLTCKDELEYKVKGFKLGAVDYITKPITPDEALARIKTHLTLRNLQKRLEEKNRRLQQEIAERKQAEAKLTETFQLLETTLNSTHMLVVYLDQRFNFVWVNRAYAQADDRDPSFFPGKNHFDLYPDPGNKEIFDRVVETGEPYFAYAKPFEYPEQPKRGATYWDWSLIPIKDSAGQVTGLVFTLVDISRRVRAEEQIKASLREKELLLKEIHHRVKNNLQVINSLLSLQANQLKDRESAAILREIRNRVFSIALVHEKLYESEDLTNINFGEYIHTLTANLLETFPPGPPAVKLEMITDDLFLQVDKAIPCALIVNELVINALKYAFIDGRQGEISIELKTAAAGEEVALMVTDNGPGLPDAFDIENVETLGMQIIRALVGQLHGSLRIDTSKGTKFTLRFPIKDGNDTAG
ncbi:MAG: response regulator [Candidatus Aminicenantes bacterium]|nr:response regulator [Candidatus Aminicenantes bacterium]